MSQSNAVVEPLSNQDNDTELVPASDPRSAVVSIDPERHGGTPCFAGSRVPIRDLWDYLEHGQTLDDFLDDFPTVTRERAVGLLEMASDKFVAGLVTK